MAEKKRPTAVAASDAREKFIERGSAGGLNGLFGSLRQSGDVCAPDLAFHFQFRRESLNELCIGCTRASAQLVIEMTNGDAPIAAKRKQMQERHRIPAAGHADEVAAGWRKSSGDFGWQR